MALVLGGGLQSSWLYLGLFFMLVLQFFCVFHFHSLPWIIVVQLAVVILDWFPYPSDHRPPHCPKIFFLCLHLPGRIHCRSSLLLLCIHNLLPFLTRSLPLRSLSVLPGGFFLGWLYFISKPVSFCWIRRGFELLLEKILRRWWEILLDCVQTFLKATGVVIDNLGPTNCALPSLKRSIVLWSP